MKIKQYHFVAILALILTCFAVNTAAQESISTLITDVQKNSQQFYDSIESVTFSGKSKSYVYVNWKLLSMKMIPEYEEYIFQGRWMKPDSLQMNILATRIAQLDTNVRTEINTGSPLPNPFQFSYNTSVLGMDTDNRKDKKGQKALTWPIFPFAAGADSVYTYKYGGRIQFNRNKIVIIDVKPKVSDVPAVIGSFMIDPEEKIVVGSDVVFNEASAQIRREIEEDNTPFLAKILIGDVTEDHRIKTKKALTFSRYWLPQTMEEEFYATVMGIKVKIHRIIEFEEYEVNPVIKDTTVFKNRKINYAIDPLKEKLLTAGLPNPTKLTPEEERRLTANIEDVFSSMELSNDLLNSNALAKEAFKLRMGKKGGSYLNMAQEFGNFIQFNRVEGTRIGYGVTVANPGIKNSVVSLSAGYGTEDKRAKAEADLIWYVDSGKRLFLEAGGYYTAEYKEDHNIISTGKNTVTCLFAHRDYRDYYYKSGGIAGIGYQFTGNFAAKLSAISHKEENAEANSRFSLFRWDKPYRFNPAIMEGYYNGLQFKTIYKKEKLSFNIQADYTDEDLLKSAFTFKRLSTRLSLMRPFSRTRTLYLNLRGGLSDGKMPPQYWFDFGGKTFLNYYGNLRGVDYKYFTGDKMVSGVLEYEWYPADMFDLTLKDTWYNDARRLLRLTLWGGAGWSELSDGNRYYSRFINTPQRETKGTYHEFGIGISDRFNLCRVDFIRNSIEKNKILFSVNFFR